MPSQRSTWPNVRLVLLCAAGCCSGCSLLVDPPRLPAADSGPADQEPAKDAPRVDRDIDQGADVASGCTLTASGPITVETDGQIVEKLRITSTGGDAVTVSGKTNVVIRDCEIHHSGGHGIVFSAAHDLRIERVVVVHDGAPASGQNDSRERDNINGQASNGLVIDDVRLIRGASGIHLVSSPAAQISFVEGHDVRGPYPKGQLVRLEACDDAVLEDFSCINPPSTSWPESIVSIHRSSNVTVRRGLIDGCNAPSGNGVLFTHTDGASRGGLCEDVDAVRMGNGCFSCYPARDVVFRRTRCRDSICTDQGRGAPESGGLGWAGEPSSEGLQLLDSKYYHMCTDSPVWMVEEFSPLELTEEDFTLRSPIALSFCWDAATP